MTESVPDKWVPWGRENAEPEPMFAVGVEKSPGEFGMTAGPFREMEDALETVPGDEVSAGPVYVLRTPAGERLFVWDADEAAWRRCPSP